MTQLPGMSGPAALPHRACCGGQVPAPPPGLQLPSAPSRHHGSSQHSHPQHHPGWKGPLAPPGPSLQASSVTCSRAMGKVSLPPAHWHLRLILPHSPAISAPAWLGGCQIHQRVLHVRKCCSPWVNKPGASNPLRQQTRMPVLAHSLPSTLCEGSRVQPGSKEAAFVVLKGCGS